METTDGFYKLDTELLYAPNFVCGPDFTLDINEKNNYTYPVDGWYWFDSLESASIFFGVDYPII